MKKKNIMFLKAIVSSTKYRYKNLNFKKKKITRQLFKKYNLKYLNYKFIITILKYLAVYNNYKYKINFNCIIFD